MRCAQAMVAPHPMADLFTEEEAVTLFKLSHAAAFYVAGAHRRASHVPSVCTAHASISDPTHERQTMMQVPLVVDKLCVFVCV